MAAPADDSESGSAEHPPPDQSSSPDRRPSSDRARPARGGKAGPYRPVSSGGNRTAGASVDRGRAKAVGTDRDVGARQRPAPQRAAGPAGSGYSSGSARSAVGSRGRQDPPTRAAGVPAEDPRRVARRARAQVQLPDEVDARMLDTDVRRDLRSLAKDTAELVARHLVRTGQLLDEDPQQALTHARAAVALAGRVSAVREAAGLAAYAAGEWREAMSELRTARRLSGSVEHLAVLADCERGLGRPERALAVLDDPEVARLDPASRVELLVVVSGARGDLGQRAAAVLVLRDEAVMARAEQPWSARLWYAYADALESDDRAEQAVEWFARAAAADRDGSTDADDRLLALEGTRFVDPPAADLGAGNERAAAAEVDNAEQRSAEQDEIADLLALVTERSRQGRSKPTAQPDRPS